MNFQNKTKAEKNTRLDRIGAVASLGLLLAVAATIGISATADSTKGSVETNVSKVDISQTNKGTVETGNTPAEFRTAKISVGNVPNK